MNAGGLPQKLHLFNGGLLNARIGRPGGRLHKLLAARTAPIDIIREFYRVGLNRNPTSKEQTFWSKQIDELTSDNERHEYLEDFVWGLLTSNEFTTNH